MIPSFAETTTSPKSVPQPPRFRAPSGRIRDVRLNWTSGYTRVAGHTTAQQNGLRYESQVQEYLCDLLGAMYAPSPTIWFTDDIGPRTCIPDGVYIHDNEFARHMVVFEIKVQHMPEAYWQLKRLYEPVLRACDTLPIHSIEIVKSYDPSMPFPVEVELIDNLTSYLANPGPRFGVFQWRK